MRKSMAQWKEWKRAGRKIVMLTCYDYPTAVMQEATGVDVVFVGDSVGTNVLGYPSEKDVTLDEIVYHLKTVRRGVEHAYLLADMPYRTYETPLQALDTARRLLDNGADGVKFEGFRPEIAAALRQEGIEACAHLGYTPQLLETPSLQGKTAERAAELLEQALEMEKAGAEMLVLELVPAELAGLLTSRLAIPTIGIGAGPDTDGQVQIVSDLLGAQPRKFRHAKRYAEAGAAAREAFARYADDVRGRRFPAEEHTRRFAANELCKLEALLNPRVDSQ